MARVESPVKLSRRVFIGEALAGSAAVAVVGSAVYLASKKELNYERLDGKAIEGESLRKFETSPLPESEWIILRSKPNQSDSTIIGYTNAGQEFYAQAEYGVAYNSGVVGLGNFEKDGELYGKWFRGAGLPLYIQKGDKIVPALNEKGQQIKTGTVHVAGNFLEAVQEED